MPFLSKKQNAWAHTPAGTKALGGKSAVKEWESATNYNKLPEKKRMAIKTIEPNKKGQKPISFHEGGLHASTKTAGSKKISASKHAEAKSGKLGKKAEKQEMFYENVLKHRKAHRTYSESDMGDMSHYDPNFGENPSKPAKQSIGNAVKAVAKPSPKAGFVSPSNFPVGKGNANSTPMLSSRKKAHRIPLQGMNMGRKERNLGYSKVKVGSPMVGKTSIPTPADRTEKRLRAKIQKGMGNIKSNFRF